MLLQSELRDRLTYDAATGVFVWIKTAYNKRQYIGRRAGGFDGEGYISIKIDGVKYRAHHLAWLYVYGVWPSNILDHKDGNKANNAIANLREVTYAENSQNQRAAHRDSSHGFMGVDFNKRKKRWRARIQCGDKRVTLGGFETAEAAQAAYLAAKREFHRTCTV